VSSDSSTKQFALGGTKCNAHGFRGKFLGIWEDLVSLGTVILVTRNSRTARGGHRFDLGDLEKWHGRRSRTGDPATATSVTDSFYSAVSCVRVLRQRACMGSSLRILLPSHEVPHTLVGTGYLTQLNEADPSRWPTRRDGDVTLSLSLCGPSFRE